MIFNNALNNFMEMSSSLGNTSSISPAKSRQPLPATEKSGTDSSEGQSSADYFGGASGTTKEAIAQVAEQAQESSNMALAAKFGGEDADEPDFSDWDDVKTDADILRDKRAERRKKLGRINIKPSCLHSLFKSESEDKGEGEGEGEVVRKQHRRKTGKKSSSEDQDDRYDFLADIQKSGYVNFGKLTKFFEGDGCEYVDDFTRVGILTMGDDGKHKFTLKSGVISIGGVVNCLVVDRKSGSRNLSDYLKKVTAFMENGLYCPRQYWQQVKYALGLIRVLDVVLRIIQIDGRVLRSYECVSVMNGHVVLNAIFAVSKWNVQKTGFGDRRIFERMKFLTFSLRRHLKSILLLNSLIDLSNLLG